MLFTLLKKVNFRTDFFLGFVTVYWDLERTRYTQFYAPTGAFKKECHLGIDCLNSEIQKKNYMTCLRSPSISQWAKVASLQKFFFSCKPMKKKELMGGFQKGGQGVRTPPPPLMSPKIGVSKHTGPVPLIQCQSFQASIRCWAISQTPFKQSFAGGSMMALLIVYSGV